MSHRMVSRVVVAAALSALFCACSGSKTPEPAEPSASQPAAPGAPAATGEASEPAAAASDEASDAGAATASETPEDCKFRVKGFCFAAEEDACNAAGCAPGACLVLVESKPAKVKCRD
jgi:hypothetical protein